jgi:non-heme chloroperoxidase
MRPQFLPDDDPVDPTDTRRRQMTAVAQPGTTKIHTVLGGGGLRLDVREWGRADGPPILFIHGLSQSHLCWAKQYQSALAGEFRLVATTCAATGCRRRAHGQDRIGAINFVGGAVKLGQAAFGTLIGPGFLDHFADATADDLPTNIRGMRGLVKGWPAKPYPPEEVETLLCSSMVVPARIRANLGAREIDGDDVLRTLQRPLLVSQGRADTVVLPAMAEHVLATCPTAEPSWYDGVGHTPHLEQPERFNRELAALTRRVRA